MARVGAARQCVLVYTSVSQKVQGLITQQRSGMFAFQPEGCMADSQLAGHESCLQGLLECTHKYA